MQGGERPGEPRQRERECLAHASLQPSPSGWPSIIVFLLEMRHYRRESVTCWYQQGLAEPGNHGAPASHHHPSLAAPGPGAGPGSAVGPRRARM